MVNNEYLVIVMAHIWTKNMIGALIDNHSHEKNYVNSFNEWIG